MDFLKNIFLSFAAALILMPATFSFVHIFSGHDHKVCRHYAERHYHAKPFDCQLHKFHQHPALQLAIFSFEPVVDQEQEKPIFNYYQFLSDYQKLPFELRGPPYC
ncbi:MAG: hypothetical protein WCE57_09200 [Salegentibacter sp.]